MTQETYQRLGQKELQLWQYVTYKLNVYVMIPKHDSNKGIAVEEQQKIIPIFVEPEEYEQL